MLARLSKPHFWHEVAVLLGGPIAMSFFSLGIARLVEQGVGPVIPPLHETGMLHGTRLEGEGGSLPQASVKETSNSIAMQNERGSASGDEHVDGNDPSKTMRQIFAFS